MQILEGNISVKAALLSPYRLVEKILIDEKKRTRDTTFIMRKAKEARVEVYYETREKIDALASGYSHGGMLAYVHERQYQEIHDLADDINFFAFVEGIEDPYNFAYILRSLYAAGCQAIITNERNWSNAANVLAKASAGASEYLAHICTANSSETLSTLKKQNIAIVCAMRDDQAIELYDYNFKQAVCICIGGEKRGLSKDILKLSNQNVYIPYRSNFRNALNASSATTILAFEIVRQRKHP
ncbi:MAG: TrmH family RNA methyltransferase [Breznakia sp.]